MLLATRSYNLVVAYGAAGDTIVHLVSYSLKLKLGISLFNTSLAVGLETRPYTVLH